MPYPQPVYPQQFLNPHKQMSYQQQQVPYQQPQYQPRAENNPNKEGAYHPNKTILQLKK
jgi:hypothetical protein